LWCEYYCHFLTTIWYLLLPNTTHNPSENRKIDNTMASTQSQHQSQPDKDENLDGYSYLFGNKLTNSLSPELHGVVYTELGLNWAQKRLDSDDIPAFLSLISNPKCFGTLPIFLLSSSTTSSPPSTRLPYFSYLRTPKCTFEPKTDTPFQERQ